MKLMHDGAGYHITKKGYPRFNCGGRFRGAYVHRHEASKKLGRPLRKDEVVHHIDGVKANFAQGNLAIIGAEVHGWISAHQSWYMKFLDIRSEQEFYAFLEAQHGEGGGLPCQ